MNKFKTSEDNYWRNLLTRSALVIVSVVIIVWFLPRNSGPQFRYDVGKPWMYGSLIAKFDFPIYKTDEAIKAEQDSLLVQLEPYYTFKENVEKEQIAKFYEKYKDGIPGLSKDYVTTIIDRLHRLYQAGIMNQADYSKNFKDSTSFVRVINGRTATSVPINCIYSTMAAYEQLFMDEKLGAQRQILQKCNLNEYLTPNLTYDKERSETERADVISSVWMNIHSVYSAALSVRWCAVVPTAARCRQPSQDKPSSWASS